MWRELEEEAIYIGLDLNYFWSLNPKQYKKHCDIFLKRQDQEIQLKDRLNHILGQYIGIAINNGAEYPEYPYLSNELEEKNAPQTETDMERVARQNTLFMGGVIHDNRRTTSINNSQY